MTSLPGGPSQLLGLSLGTGCLPVPNLMGDGDPQIEASILSDEAAPERGAGTPQLGDPPNLPVTIRQLQVKPWE